MMVVHGPLRTIPCSEQLFRKTPPSMVGDANGTCDLEFRPENIVGGANTHGQLAGYFWSAF